MCRMRSHSPTATTTAVTKTTSWLESNGMSPGSFQSIFGLGPMAGGRPTWVTSPLRGMTNPTVFTSWSLSHVVRAGIAMSRPTVAMILADSVARARGRNTLASSRRPNSGANTRITNTAAGTIGQWSPELSW